MKRHYSIVQANHLNEFLTCEVHGTLDNCEEAVVYFNNCAREFFDKMKEQYTNCEFVWAGQTNVFCHCDEGVSQLVLLMSSSDVTNKTKIISTLKYLGEDGRNEGEKYVDIYAKIKYDKMSLEQMFYDMNTDKLTANFVNKKGEVVPIDWDSLDEDVRNEISSLKIWD